MTVKIIAEIGVNHDGDMKKALQYIDCAKRCGADAVKFQMFKAKWLEPEGPRRDMLEALELGVDDHIKLMDHAEEVGIEYICTPFDPYCLEWLVRQGVKTIKVASGYCHDKDLLRAAALSGCEIIMSLGMASREDAIDAMKILGRATLLHCISAYPTPIEDMNLKHITILKATWPTLDIGLSDHSVSHILPAAAVGMGATVIEKHLTFNPWSGYGPDHKASLNPISFVKMCEHIREVESAMGSGEYSRPACEEEVKTIVQERREYASNNKDFSAELTLPRPPSVNGWNR